MSGKKNEASYFYNFNNFKHIVVVMVSNNIKKTLPNYYNMNAHLI